MLSADPWTGVCWVVVLCSISKVQNHEKSVALKGSSGAIVWCLSQPLIEFLHFLLLSTTTVLTGCTLRTDFSSVS